MTDCNSPQERAIASERETIRRALLREFSNFCDEDRAAEELSRETWQFLGETEPDANRRASLWLLSRGMFALGFDDSLDGARRVDRWIRAMCKAKVPFQPR